ncbi:hypothetical protein CABS01_05203 [Colletotrichum abscissum]|uniref:uncharacterized protein n=1 Tax=Colletotrichum abscissum TaxID=1671311 RepID=UPI0027D48991|nr:uncharacterized protein CABS01_05203 [Colletotrichum abscissum]KAK1523582.1 hypothetical protein CABS01_05203 [Colletotrichum abscissum]
MDRWHHLNLLDGGLGYQTAYNGLFCPMEGRCVTGGMLQVCETLWQANGMQGEVEVNGVSSEADSKGEPASEVYGDYSLMSSGPDGEEEEDDADDGRALGMRMKSRKDESTISERMFGDEQGRG